MGRHRNKILRRGWWQVILPAAAFAGLLSFTGGVVVHYAAATPQALSVPAPRVSAIPPLKSFRHPPVRASAAPVPVTYATVSGDSWWSIAQDHCHNGNDYITLAKANHTSPGVLQPGRVIILEC